MLVISPYVKPGAIYHAYSDHGSSLKFIEKSWNIAPLSQRNATTWPIQLRYRPHVPTKRPIEGRKE
jgi:phospholipase C